MSAPSTRKALSKFSEWATERAEDAAPARPPRRAASAECKGLAAGKERLADLARHARHRTARGEHDEECRHIGIVRKGRKNPASYRRRVRIAPPTEIDRIVRLRSAAGVSSRAARVVLDESVARSEPILSSTRSTPMLGAAARGRDEADAVALGRRPARSAPTARMLSSGSSARSTPRARQASSKTG